MQTVALKRAAVLFQTSMQTVALITGKGAEMSYTIKDIAKKVGVSPSTVSRVINGTATISEETTRKIRVVMEELDYHPNSMARSFATGLTKTIALVIDAADEKSFANSFFNRSVFAIEKQAQELGFNLLIANGNKAFGMSASQLVYEKKVDGLIIPPTCMNTELLKLVKDLAFPCVLLGKPKQKKQELSWVDIDNRGGSRLAVDHLMQQGYKAPILVIEDETTVFGKDRCLGYKDAVEEGKQCIIDCSKEKEDLYTLLKRYCDKGNMDAVICSNNELAYKITRQLKKIGCNIPKDIGVITFDNYPLAEYMDPPLSVIDVDTYTLGVEAVKMLIGKIRKKDGDAGSKTIPTGLIPRRSTIRKDS